MVKYCTKLI